MTRAARGGYWRGPVDSRLVVVVVVRVAVAAAAARLPLSPERESARARTHVRTHARTRTHTRAHRHAHTRTRTHTSAHVRTHTCARTHAHQHGCTRRYLYGDAQTRRLTLARGVTGGGSWRPGTADRRRRRRRPALPHRDDGQSRDTAAVPRRQRTRAARARFTVCGLVFFFPYKTIQRYASRLTAALV